MRHIVPNFIFALALLLLAGSSAPADARDVLSSRELIKLISLDAPLNELEGAMNGAALKEIQGKAKGARDAKFAAAWKKAVHGAFSGSELQEELAAKLDGLLTPKEQQIILDFYSKGLGKTVTQLEKVAQTQEMRWKS